MSPDAKALAPERDVVDADLLGGPATLAAMQVSMDVLEDVRNAFLASTAEYKQNHDGWRI
ncbi:MAG: hypothetical protein ACJAVS_002864, partial [Paracoccaceae bacterium]